MTITMLPGGCHQEPPTEHFTGATVPAVSGPPPRRTDLATPLSDVTFVVVDTETTGVVPGRDRIIEVGAAKYRGGECLGTFQTLVNPGCAVPPAVVVLTGITEMMTVPAPRIEEVLPAFLEWAGDAVLVGHNLRFDVAFLDAALAETGRPRLTMPRVDTLSLARRLVRDEVPDMRLGTLAVLFRSRTPPVHRALEDALATAEVLHGLIERLAAYGTFALDDLLFLPTRPIGWARLGLTADLPRAPGVYVFRDAAGRVLYVGSAANLRLRVRSSLALGMPPALIRRLRSIVHRVCKDEAAAAALARRLVLSHKPPFNRQRKRRRQRRARGPFR